MSGIELFLELQRRGEFLPVIVLTAYGNIRHSVTSVKLGVFDYFEKPADSNALFAAVQGAFEADRQFRRQRLLGFKREDLLNRLTRREREVVDLLLKGKSSKMIAADLGISSRTVDIHRANIMAKMQVRTGPELVYVLSSLPGVELADRDGSPPPDWKGSPRRVPNPTGNP